MNAVIQHQGTAVVNAQTAQEIRAQVNRIQEVMRAVFKEGTHYGRIPGAGDKPVLFKPGAEVLCMTFRIAPELRIEDLGDSDTVRYRVTCVGRHQGTGLALGEGAGEASTGEEKYKWRGAVCAAEFANTDVSRRRVKYKRDGSTVDQVRTEAADLANTVLKMACKRALVAMTLNVTAASDCFTQDLEDMPAEVREAVTEDTHPPGKPATQAPVAASTGGVATEKQVHLLRKKLDSAGMSAEDLCVHFNIEALTALPFSSVNDALAFISGN